MNLTKNIKISTLILSLLLGVSCTDLDVNYTDSTPSESGKPSADLADVMNQLSNFNGPGNVWGVLNHSADDMMGPTRGTDWGDNGVWRSLHQHTVDPNHTELKNTWNMLNSSAFKSTLLIDAGTSVPQAKFLRGFFRFYIVDIFGQLPDRLSTDGVEVLPQVYPRSEATGLVISDLESSISGLPSNGDATSITKNAAYAYLAKVYLNKGVYTAADAGGPFAFDAADMNKVIEYCNLIINSGKYTLEENYFDNFLMDTGQTENVFAANQQGSNYAFMTLHYNQNPSGWNGFTTLSEFYNTFGSSDKRVGGSASQGIGYGFLVGQQYGDSGQKLFERGGSDLSFTKEVPLLGATEAQGIRVIKYHPTNPGHIALIRYSDILLMKAEAILRGGTDPMGQSAQMLVDMVTSVRNGASVSATLDNLLAERGRELYWESWRRNDLIRYGKFGSAWQEKDADPDTHTNLFPIPATAIISNPNLTQNPGY